MIPFLKPLIALIRQNWIIIAFLLFVVLFVTKPFDMVSIGNQINYNSSNITCNNGQCSLANTYDSGLVASYPLTDDFYDYSGNANHGTGYGGVTANGSETVFDGVNDYIVLDNSLVPVGTNEGTISFWYKRVASNELLDFIMYCNGPTDDRFYVIHEAGGSSTKLSFKYGSNSDRIASTTNFNNDEWNFVTLKIDTTKHYLYVNNILEASKITSVEVDEMTTNFYIGKDTLNQGLNGSIKDVRIYDRALTETEISNIYTSTKAYYQTGDLCINDIELVTDNSSMNYCKLSSTQTLNGGVIDYTINGADVDNNVGFEYGGTNSFDVCTTLTRGSSTSSTPVFSSLDLSCQATPFESAISSSSSDTISPTTLDILSMMNMQELESQLNDISLSSIIWAKIKQLLANLGINI